MNLVQLRYAQAVLREGSFGAAARACSVTQPALSNGIAALERSLGGQLFERSTRGVRPTPFGERILPLVASAVHAADLVRAEARLLAQGQARSLRVGVSPLIGPALVGLVFEAAGRVLPERTVVLRSAALADLDRALDAGDLDVALTPGPLPPDPVGRSPISSSPITPATAAPHGRRSAMVAREPVVVVAPATASPPGQGERGPVEIAAVPMPLVLATDACGLSPFTRRLFDEGGVPVTAYAGQAHDCRILLDWVALGLGTALLPASKVGAGTQAYPLHLDGVPVTIAYQLSWAQASPLAAQLAELSGLIAREGTAADRVP